MEIIELFRLFATLVVIAILARVGIYMKRKNVFGNKLPSKKR